MASVWTALMLSAFIQYVQLLSVTVSYETFSHVHRDKGLYRKPLTEVRYICPVECNCYTVESSNLTVDCNSRELTKFPSNLHSSVSVLHLAENKINNLHYNDSFSLLTVLNISNNELIRINVKWLSTLENLRVLDLSVNLLHSKTVQNAFQNPLLENLNLSYNKLDEISGSVFRDASMLLILDLSSNEIENISHDAFWSQTYLKILNLSLNELNDLKYEWFKNLHNLDTLNLKNNKLKLLRNVVFSSLNNLHHLDLSNNFIKSVGLLSFKGLSNLKFLNVSHNDISHFQDGVFRFLDSLKIIDLSQNPFMSIDNIFIYSNKLNYLYMNGLSNFEKLTSSSLTGLKELEYLDMSRSKKLSDINIKAFIHIKKVKNIDISDAKLNTLKYGVFNYLEKVETVTLKGNPWKCDCYMYWLLLWLGEHTTTHLLSPSETYCSTPITLQGHVLLDALDHNMICTNATIQHYTTKTKFRVGSPAYLECQAEGNPHPRLTWITPQKTLLHWVRPKNHTDEFKDLEFQTTTTQPVLKDALTTAKGRFYLMANGFLAIQNVERGDGGFYTCIASNPLNNDTVSIRLTLDYDYLVHIKIVSVLVGIATSFGFLLLTLISVLIRMILKHFGIKSPCRNGNASPRTQQIKKILESMEHYKKQQLDKLRDNYNGQVQRIKDNCMLQMERLRESYSSQAERLRDIKEYGTLQIDRIRENYYSQVQRVRDYSASQIIRLRENYIYQRNRIRKFSAHHLYKLRENYKLQQQHLNKILENLNIESCRNVCQRTDSVVFEPEITLENVLVPKICLQTFTKETCDSIDNSSQISAYFTPDEAVSEVSGHESDEHDSFEESKQKSVDELDIRKTENESKSNNDIPDHKSQESLSSQLDYTYTKTLSETIV